MDRPGGPGSPRTFGPRPTAHPARRDETRRHGLRRRCGPERPVPRSAANGHVIARRHRGDRSGAAGIRPAPTNGHVITRRHRGLPTAPVIPDDAPRRDAAPATSKAPVTWPMPAAAPGVSRWITPGRTGRPRRRGSSRRRQHPLPRPRPDTSSGASARPGPDTERSDSPPGHGRADDDSLQSLSRRPPGRPRPSREPRTSHGHRRTLIPPKTIAPRTRVPVEPNRSSSPPAPVLPSRCRAAPPHRGPRSA